MRTSVLMVLLLLAIHLAACSQNPNDSIQTNPFTFKIAALEKATTCTAYLGGGATIEPPPKVPGTGGGVPVFSMQREKSGDVSSQQAGEITAKEGTSLLIVHLEVNNPSTTTQDFRPLEISIVDPTCKLTGLGAGSIPFAKQDADWEKVRKAEPESIPSGKTWKYTYVFSVPKDSSSWNLAYKGTEFKAFDVNYKSAD
jgi:hypothetical protein